MKVVVTGGTGFIGSRLALRCVEAGESVRVLGQRRTPAEGENAQALEARGVEVSLGSVTDRACVSALVRGADVVYHLAAAQHEANVPDSHFHQVNVDGTRNVLDASVAGGVGRLVHGSTIGVYGGRPGETVNEDSPLRPDNVYGTTKLEAEGHVRAARLPTVIVRISETYGPGDRRLLKLFRGVQRGWPVLIGRGRNLHHLIHVDDLVEGLRRAARAPGAAGQSFVLAGERPVPTRELVAEIARALGRRPPRLRLPLAPLLAAAALLEWTLRPLGIQPPLHRRRMDFFRKSFAFSDRRARELLGWQPALDLPAGLASCVRWYRQQGLLQP